MQPTAQAAERRKNAAHGASRGAAQECSPRRKPWANRRKMRPAPKGRKKRGVQARESATGFWVAQRFSAAITGQLTRGFSR